jgi:hypothetical protein
MLQLAQRTDISSKWPICVAPFIIPYFYTFSSYATDRDGYGNKPWVDDSASAPKQFLDAQSVWEATWGEGDTRGMTVQSVKLFSRNACDL